MERIHVVGLGPRTGTTLMAESMIACFAIDAYDEHEAPVSRLRRHAEVYLSKSPGDIATIRWRLILDRHFHAICMVRDPRDVVTSRHGNNPDVYWAPLRMWKRSLANGRRSFRRRRFILVRYEDLATTPDAVQAEIAKRLPFLRKTANFSEFHTRAAPAGPAVTALGGVRAINTDSIGNWRRHLPRVAGQIARHGAIDAELIEFGYEKDRSWLAELDGIEPDMTPSHWSEARPGGVRNRIRYARAHLAANVRLARVLIERAAGRSIG
jgi:hypothetical protein